MLNAHVHLASCLERRRCEALLKSDQAELDLLLSPKLVYMHSSGVRDNKNSFLTKLADGSLKYLSLEFSQIGAQASDDSLIVTGLMTAKVLKAGQEKAVSSLFMTVWANEELAGGRRWRLFAHQGCPKV